MMSSVTNRRAVRTESFAFATGFSERYILGTTPLGTGAYSTVLLGRDKISGESYAMKVIQKQDLKSKNEKKLITEVNILKSINHRHVVKLYDCFNEVDKYVLVMERVRGGTLDRVLAEDGEHLTEVRVRHYIRQVVSALSFCHSKGIVHRDIKPENILITEAGDVKVVDFNLSKQLTPEGIHFSLLQTQCGTPTYIAPEILDTAHRAYNYKCDIWSVGVLSYYLLSGGLLPFNVCRDVNNDQALDQLLLAVRTARWTFTPEQLWDGKSAQSKDFIERCLKRNPEDRMDYSQMEEHKWFLKEEDGKMKQEYSVAKAVVRREQQRKMLVAGLAKRAANLLGKLMGPAENMPSTFPMREGELQPSGIFLFNSSFDSII